MTMAFLGIFPKKNHNRAIYTKIIIISKTMQIRPLSQQIAIALTQSFSGCVSLIASAIIIYRISGSDLKLKSPFTRLLLCICIGDIVLSATFVVSTMPSPPTDGIWGSVGNVITCDIQGFLSTFTVVSVSLYNAALCSYYLCVVKYNMSDRRFSEKVEPYLHMVVWVWSLSVSLYMLVRESYNPSDTVCWANPYPSDCTSNPEVECIRGEDALTLRDKLLPIPIFFVFVAYLSMLGMIWCSVKTQENTMNQYRFRTQIERRNEEGDQKSCLSFFRSSCRQKAGRTRRTKLKEIEMQAYLYFASFLLTFGVLTIVRFTDPDMGTGEMPFWSLILGRILFPLQGLFNICVYMRPDVSSVMRRNPDFSYLRAFIVAVKTYDVDNRGRGRKGRRSSRLASSIGMHGRKRNTLFSSFRISFFSTTNRSRSNEGVSNPLSVIRNHLELVEYEVDELNIPPEPLVSVESNDASNRLDIDMIE